MPYQRRCISPSHLDMHMVSSLPEERCLDFLMFKTDTSSRSREALVAVVRKAHKRPYLSRYRAIGHSSAMGSLQQRLSGEVHVFLRRSDVVHVQSRRWRCRRDNVFLFGFPVDNRSGHTSLGRRLCKEVSVLLFTRSGHHCVTKLFLLWSTASPSKKTCELPAVREEALLPRIHQAVRERDDILRSLHMAKASNLPRKFF